MSNVNKSHLDELYKLRIKPIRDKYIQSLIGLASVPDTFSPYDKELTWAERAIPVSKLKKKSISYVSTWIENLEELKYVYVTNGNSESLHELFNRVDNLAFIKTDYPYYKQWFSATKKQHTELEKPANVKEIIVSWPGYTNGDDTELEFARKCAPEKIHLDCAHIATTQPPDRPLNAVEFETVSISFSKTLAIPYNRLGLIFSKNPIPQLEILNKVFYVNLSAVKLALILLENLPIDYWWKTYGARLEDLCEKNNLIATKSILFAYEKLGRRISLAPYWNAYE